MATGTRREQWLEWSKPGRWWQRPWCCDLKQAAQRRLLSCLPVSSPGSRPRSGTARACPEASGARQAVALIINRHRSDALHRVHSVGLRLEGRKVTCCKSPSHVLDQRVLALEQVRGLIDLDLRRRHGGALGGCRLVGCILSRRQPARQRQDSRGREIENAIHDCWRLGLSVA